MPESIRSILVRCRNFIDTTKVPAYPAGADLADEIDDVLRAAQPAGAQQPGAVYAAPEVLDALNWVDDFIARCNGDDRGACESVNVLRRAFASHGQAPAAAPAQAIGPCVICGSDEPFTGTCGSGGDPRALCKQPAPQQEAQDAAFEAVRKNLCALQRYSFCLDDDGVVRRVQDRTGNWIEFDDAHALFDPVAVDAARKQGGAT